VATGQGWQQGSTQKKKKRETETSMENRIDLQPDLSCGIVKTPGNPQ
jgi:hypothetical protein